MRTDIWLVPEALSVRPCVATMSGITEVNPLSPHYYCPKCHYSDFDSEEVKKYSGMSGCDMPDKECPVCGTHAEKGRTRHSI